MFRWPRGNEEVSKTISSDGSGSNNKSKKRWSWRKRRSRTDELFGSSSPEEIAPVVGIIPAGGGPLEKLLPLEVLDIETISSASSTDGTTREPDSNDDQVRSLTESNVETHSSVSQHGVVTSPVRSRRVTFESCEAETFTMHSDISREWSPNRGPNELPTYLTSPESACRTLSQASPYATVVRAVPSTDEPLPQFTGANTADSLVAGLSALDASRAAKASTLASLLANGKNGRARNLRTTYGYVANAQAVQAARLVSDCSTSRLPTGSVIERSHSEPRSQAIPRTSQLSHVRSDKPDRTNVCVCGNILVEDLSHCRICGIACTQTMPPVATCGVDTTSNGKANIYTTGVDRNRDGIPDILRSQQTAATTALPSAAMPIVEQAMPSIATCGIDITSDGKANIHMTGVDRSRSGIPDTQEVRVNSVGQALEECVRVLHVSSSDLQRLEGETFGGNQELQRIAASLRNAAEMGMVVLGYIGCGNAALSSTISTPRPMSGTATPRHSSASSMGGVYRHCRNGLATPVTVEVVGRTEQDVSFTSGAPVQNARLGSPGTGQQRYLQGALSSYMASSQTFRNTGLDSLNLSANKLNQSVSNLSMSSTTPPVPDSPAHSNSMNYTKPLRPTLAEPQMPSAPVASLGAWSSQDFAMGPGLWSSPTSRCGSFKMSPPASLTKPPGINVFSPPKLKLPSPTLGPRGDFLSGCTFNSGMSLGCSFNGSLPLAPCGDRMQSWQASPLSLQSGVALSGGLPTC